MNRRYRRGLTVAMALSLSTLSVVLGILLRWQPARESAYSSASMPTMEVAPEPPVVGSAEVAVWPPPPFVETLAPERWIRRDGPGGARWELHWRSDAGTAARLLGVLCRYPSALSFELTPGEGDIWRIRADLSGPIPGADATHPFSADTVGHAEEIARLLYREEPVSSTPRRDGDSAAKLPTIAAGGSGFVQIRGESPRRWQVSDEILTLEPVR